MHEMSLMRDLLSKVCQTALRENAHKVVSVNIWLGALSHMSPEHFQEHFDEESRGTLAEGATLQFEISDDIHHPQAQGILFRGLEIDES